MLEVPGSQFVDDTVTCLKAVFGEFLAAWQSNHVRFSYLRKCDVKFLRSV